MSNLKLILEMNVKNNSTQNIFFVITLLMFFIFFSSVTYSKQLNIAIESWPPYVGKNLPNKGLATKIVVHALKRAGYQSSIHIETWNRVLKGSEVGFFDVIVTIWETQERKNNFLLSDPYFNNKLVFISLVDKAIEYENMSDLHGLTVATIDGYAYDNKFMRDKNIIKRPSQQLTRNLLLLMEKKVDLVLADQFLLAYTIKTFLLANANKFKIIEKPLTVRGLRIGVSKQNKNSAEIVKAFNKVISEMKADGSLDEIIKSYRY